MSCPHCARPDPDPPPTGHEWTLDGGWWLAEHDGIQLRAQVSEVCGAAWYFAATATARRGGVQVELASRQFAPTGAEASTLAAMLAAIAAHLEVAC